jgi:hypothetical protein
MSFHPLYTLYSVVLFIHVIGMLGLFIGMGLQWIVIYRLRRAVTVTHVRDWLGLLAFNGRLSMASTVLIIGAGSICWS